MDIKIAGKQHGLDWCIIRPHNVYGEKQNIWDKYRNVFGIWMTQHFLSSKKQREGGSLTNKSHNISDFCLSLLQVVPTENRNCPQHLSKKNVKMGYPLKTKTAPNIKSLKNAAYWIRKAYENGNSEAEAIWNKHKLWKYE